MNTLACRSCGTPLHHTLVDLGEMPLANSYLTPDIDLREEPQYPLHVKVCDTCFLVQVENVVTPEDIFCEYAYFSSYSQSWVEHAKNYAHTINERLSLGVDDFIIEVASNDGYLLKHFVDLKLKVLGIEPAGNVAAKAENIGVPTWVDFFSDKTAKKIRAHHGQATLMTANNVLAHVPDINDFVRGFVELLKPEGVATFEFPHVLEMIRHVQFDTIYHEHFSYLSLYAVEKCFHRHGLRVFDIEHLSTHGGSLRVWSCKQKAQHKETDALRAARISEREFGIDTLGAYEGFSKKVQSTEYSLLSFLQTARDQNKIVAGYGAAAKGNTLLNYAGITTNLIPFVVDANPYKQGTLLPGSHIPVLAPEAIIEHNPDYILILPWNLRTEISRSLNELTSWSGLYVTAIPHFEVFR